MFLNRTLPFVVGLLMLSSQAIAQSTTVIVGQPLDSPTGTFQNVSSPFDFNLPIRQQHSYCCSAVADNAVAIITEVASEAVLFGAPRPIPFAVRGDMTPIISEPGGFNPIPESRACLIVPKNVLSIKFTVQTRDGQPAFTTLRVSCDETTLVGGFNTVAGEFNFLEVTKAEPGPLRIIVTGISNTFFGQMFAFGFDFESNLPFEREDFDIHSRVAPSSFGPILLTHDGTPSSITASLAQYKTNTPQPGDFLKVGVVPFERPR